MIWRGIFISISKILKNLQTLKFKEESDEDFIEYVQAVIHEYFPENADENISHFFSRHSVDEYLLKADSIRFFLSQLLEGSSVDEEECRHIVNMYFQFTDMNLQTKLWLNRYVRFIYDIGERKFEATIPIPIADMDKYSIQWWFEKAEIRKFTTHKLSTKVDLGYELDEQGSILVLFCNIPYSAENHEFEEWYPSYLRGDAMHDVKVMYISGILSRDHVFAAFDNTNVLFNEHFLDPFKSLKFLRISRFSFFQAYIADTIELDPVSFSFTKENLSETVVFMDRCGFSDRFLAYMKEVTKKFEYRDAYTFYMEENEDGDLIPYPHDRDPRTTNDHTNIDDVPQRTDNLDNNLFSSYSRLYEDYFRKNRQDSLYRESPQSSQNL